MGAYASYWVYQHLGNLSPEELDADDVYARCCAITDDDERTRYLDRDGLGRRRRRRDDPVELLPGPRRRGPQGAPGGHRRRAAPATSTPTTVGWSTPSSGHGCAGRCWSRTTRTPPRARFDIAVPAAAGHPPPRGVGRGTLQGAWGRPGSWFGEWLRQFLDLEHWASFGESFGRSSSCSPISCGPRRRRDRPAAVGGRPLQLHRCGDAAEDSHPGTAIHQLTMSPFRNDIERAAKLGQPALPHDVVLPPPSGAWPGRPASPSRTSRGSSTKAHGSTTV